MLRHGVRQLERCRHPRLLHVLHSVEETADTLAFATEPVTTSLGNVLAAAEDRASASDSPTDPADQPAAAPAAPGGQNGQQPAAGTTVTKDGIKVAELPFLDIEIKYGLFQVGIPSFRPSVYGFLVINNDPLVVRSPRRWASFT